MWIWIYDARDHSSRFDLDLDCDGVETTPLRFSQSIFLNTCSHLLMNNIPTRQNVSLPKIIWLPLTPKKNPGAFARPDRVREIRRPT